MEVYLDNSATTRPYDECVSAVADAMVNCYANPSALHRMGKKAEDLLEKSRVAIAKTLSCREKEIFFTSGGTEGDNLAIIGYALANRRNGNKIITQKTEHMAVLQSFKFLETQGFDVFYANVGKDGTVDVSEIKNVIDENTILISIMHANNETGAIMPIDEISSLVDHKNCMLHVDAVQTYGKIPINTKTFGADMITVSSHKIHGPNGVGALYVRDSVRLSAQMHGGSQEKGLRSGTENSAGIVGFAKAAEICFKNIDENSRHMQNLKEYLENGILNLIDGAVINSPKSGICSILSVAFPGIKSEVLLHVLESHGIYVSTGSACNSKKKLSYVLSSMGLGDAVTDGTIRFSFSEFNTIEELDYTLGVLKKEVPVLKKIMK